MKKSLSLVFVGLGMLSLAAGIAGATTAQSLAEQMGRFAGAFVFLIIALALRETAAPAPAVHKDTETAAGVGQQDVKTSGTVSIAAGIFIMLVGSGLGQGDQDLLLFGLATSLCGWALLIWGCTHYANSKGYSPWFGLLGYLLLLGVLALVVMPRRHGRRGTISPVSQLLILAPLALMTAAGAVYVSSLHSSIDAQAWQEFASPEAGFSVLLPGTPKHERSTHQAAAGDVALHKFIVVPSGRKELFMVVSTGFPVDMGGVDKVLDIGRQDVLSAAQGQVTNERRIDIGGTPVLELEVHRPKGGVVKARVYATSRRLHEVIVHVPAIRRNAMDVQKYFDSFKLMTHPGPAPESGDK